MRGADVAASPLIARESEAVLGTPLVWMTAAVAAGAVISGFWNVQFFDGLGVRTFVHPLVGEFEGLATRSAELGPGFGLRFAWATGLATTWTASNCASLALLPLLVVASRRRATSVAGMVLATVLAAAAVAGLYGAFIGRLGPEGATAWNGSNIRSAQSFIVFGALGVGMIVWALAEAGTFTTRLSRTTRAFFSRPATKAALAGGMVGAFTLGRPLAVFREYLLYIAQPARIDYGALAMIVECLGALCIPMLLFAMARAAFGRRIDHWINRAPAGAATICSSALALGGTFLLFYWTLSRAWPLLGRWGFRLGLYS